MTDTLSISCHGNTSNQPLVMLHGFLGDKTDWLPIIDELKTQFYCVCFDLPGHGKSSQHQIAIPGFYACANKIMVTLASLKIQHFHLLGYSLGGRIALHLAKSYSDQVKSLHLESCHPGLTSEQEKSDRNDADRIWFKKLTSMPFGDFLSIWYQQSVFSDLNQSQRQTLIAKRQMNNPLALANCYQATSLALQENFWQLPNQLWLKHKLDCHFYLGEHDKKFANLAKNWQLQASISLQQISDSGHNCHFANPKEFATKLVQAIIEKEAARPC